MRKSAREKLADAKRVKHSQTQMTLESLMEMLLGGPILPTQRKFIYSPDRNKAYKGPAGCAKTSTGCTAGFLRALLQPGSHGLVARQDYNDLKDTTAQRLQEMVDRMPPGVLVDRDKSAPMKWYIQPAVEGPLSTITFMGLKAGLGSYEFNWALIDEADEVEPRRIHEVSTRLRAPGGDYALMLCFNPPEKTHELYTLCTGRDHQERVVGNPMFTLFEPDPKENVANLPEGYYDELAKDLPEDMRTRLIDGDWGSTFTGTPVYKQFSKRLHVRDDIQYDPSSLLFRFWDFGYNHPVCLWAQLDGFGRLKILREEQGSQIEASAFARRCNSLTALHFPHAPKVIDYGDPAVRQKKDTGSALADLASEGVLVLWSIVTIDQSLKKVRKLLETMVSGEPQIQIARRECPILIGALSGGYKMDKHGVAPVKDGFYDHSADAFRYGVWNLFGSGGAQHAAGTYSLPENLSPTE